MTIGPLGVTFPGGDLLCPPLAVADLTAAASRRTAQDVRAQAERLRPYLVHAPTFGLDLAPSKPVDVTDPAQAGWTVVVSAADPRHHRLLELIAPLARHRGMRGAPLVYPGEGGTRPEEWIATAYLAASASTRPKYVLLLGGPDTLPFSLQAELAASFASVGRLDFEADDHYASYVTKVIGLERAVDAVPRAEAVVLGVDWGSHDVTSMSHRYMAVPLADQIDGSAPFRVARLFGAQATKTAFREEVARGRPALVYTMSHGLFAPPRLGLDTQRQVNGSICCARESGQPVPAWSFGAQDVPDDRTPFGHGCLFVEFACWSFGTPTKSSFDHWRLKAPRVHADRPFVAALPKRLLRHPLGPIGFVGHVDTAWLQGFTEATGADEGDGPERRYSSRLEAYRTIIDRSLLRRWPVGYSLEDLHARTAWLSTRLATFFDRMRERDLDVRALTPQQLADLADTFVRRNDSMNFMLLGDPAARIRVGV